MDESLIYLNEARDYINMFIPISFADSFFEETEESKEVNANNNTAKTGAVGSLKKAFAALITTIKQIIQRISDFFKEKFMSAEEKERFAKFKETIKSNPEFAGMKVTIADFREYEKAYDEAIKQLEEEAKKEEPDDSIGSQIIEVLQKKIEAIAAKAKEVGARAGMSIALSTAVDIADRNKTAAQAINFALKQELVSLEEVTKQLGEAETARFEKKIDKLSRQGFLHRFKVKVLQRKELTLEAVLRDQMKKLLSFTNVGKQDKPVVNAGSVARGIAKNPKLVSDALGGPEEAAKAAKTVAGAAARAEVAKIKAKSTAKKAKRDADDFARFIGIKK